MNHLHLKNNVFRLKNEPEIQQTPLSFSHLRLLNIFRKTPREILFFRELSGLLKGNRLMASIRCIVMM